MKCPMGYVSYHRDCDVLDNRPDVFLWWRMKTWVPHADGHQAGLWRVCTVKWWLNEVVSVGGRRETQGSISARVPLKTSSSTQSCPHFNTLTYFTTMVQIKMQRHTNIIPRRTTQSEPVFLKRPESCQHSSHVLVYLSTQDQSSHWLLKWAN